MRDKQVTVLVVAGALALGSGWSAAAAPDVSDDAQDLPVSGQSATSAADPVPALPRSAPGKKKKAPTVAITVAAPKVELPGTIGVTVTVSPPGKYDVQIQESDVNTPWTTIQTVRTNSSGQGSGDVPPYTGGTYDIRALIAKTKTTERSVSNTEEVEVGYSTTVPENKFNPMVPGKVKIKKKARGTAKVGEFRVQVKKRKVTVKDGKGRVAWTSDKGRSFVAASRSDISWTERFEAGAFWADIDRDVKLTKQNIKKVKAAGKKAVITGKLRGGGDKADYKVVMKQDKRGKGVAAMKFDVQAGETKSGKRINSIQLTSQRSRGAAVHGFGEQYQPFDLSGQVLPILVQEQGVTRGELPFGPLVDQFTWGAGNLQTTYGAWPTYVTGQNRSFELVDNIDSGAFGLADMRRADQISLESFSGRMRARVVARGNPAALLKARSAGLDRPELADWIQRGAVLGIQGGTTKVRKVVADMQQAGTKVSGVWLQDWVGRRVTGFGEQLWWTWQLNKQKYPGWDQMVADFKKQDIDVLTYINPFVIDADEVDGQPIKNFYKEGNRKGYLVKNRHGETEVIQTIGFPVEIVDLTNPDARDWYADIIAEELIAVGATGFMADFGEELPLDHETVLFKGKPLKQHNRYPQLWAETVREGCKRSGVPDCVAFFRSSYLGTRENAPLMWAGDQMVNFAVEDGMASAVKGMLSGGVSGHPFWHSDIGGYTAIRQIPTNRRPPDLNARWAEMQAFGVVMRSHEGNIPAENQQVYDTAETRAQFAKASQIYAALYDYRSGVIAEGVEDGIPAMRHAWLVYPGSAAAKNDLQFFLGDHLFVAPVYEEGATSVEVTFPPGQWEHILTGQVYGGGQTTTVPAPIGTPAAFVKVGDPEGKKIINAMKAAGLRK